MKNIPLKLLIILMIFFSMLSCKKDRSAEETKKDPDTPLSKETEAVERYKVDVGDSIFRGPENAPVTIINFTDFQCPFSRRAIDLINKLLETYDGKIRYVFKHYPLPFHRMAKPASLAAIAAHKQGKFWEYHDILFDNMKEVSDANLIKWAEETGLNEDKFQKERSSSKTSGILGNDVSQGSRFGVRGTPTIFINGRRIVGANNEIISNTVMEEIANGERLRAKGVKNIYGEIVKNGLLKYTPPQRKPPEIPKDIYKIEYPSSSTIYGNVDGDVTVIVLNDYECHFSSRLHETMELLKNEYGNIFRFVHINLPLRFHKKAVPAALAALAAGRQDKFEEMNDILFRKQGEWKKAADFVKWLEKEAAELGLNIDKFNKDRADTKLGDIIENDREFAVRIGVRGTPATFINGRHISGALPVESFREVINEEFERAESIKTDDITGERLYFELIKDGKPGLNIIRGAEKKTSNRKEIVEVELKGNEPRLGSADSPVTIIEFSDFQCPFCKMGSDIINKIVKEYGGKVSLVFKHTPLDFNKNAYKAALFTIAVKNIYGDNKFFEMGDVLFNNQSKWKNEPEKVFQKFATDLGLNWNKIKEEMGSSKTVNILESDIAQAAELGVKGAPEFFINGRRVSGAKKISHFKVIIDDILKNTVQ